MLLTIESQLKNSSFLCPLPQSRWNYQRLPGQHLACHPESKLMTISYLCNSDNWWTWDGRWPAVLHSVCSLSCVKTVASIRTTFLPIPILTTHFERLTWRVFVLVPHKQTSSLPFSLPPLFSPSKHFVILSIQCYLSVLANYYRSCQSPWIIEHVYLLIV